LASAEPWKVRETADVDTANHQAAGTPETVTEVRPKQAKRFATLQKEKQAQDK